MVFYHDDAGLAPPPRPRPRWARARTGCYEADCVEVAGLPGGYIGVRDSKSPGIVLRFTPAEWAVFIGGAKAGDFDHPST
jgi:hypothetical protein